MDPEAVRAMGSRSQTLEQANAQREGMEDHRYPYYLSQHNPAKRVTMGDLVDMQPIYEDVNDKVIQGYIEQTLRAKGGFENFTDKELQGVEEQGSPEQKRALQEYLANKPPHDPNLGVLYG